MAIAEKSKDVPEQVGISVKEKAPISIPWHLMMCIMSTEFCQQGVSIAAQHISCGFNDGTPNIESDPGASWDVLSLVREWFMLQR